MRNKRVLWQNMCTACRRNDVSSDVSDLSGDAPLLEHRSELRGEKLQLI